MNDTVRKLVLNDFANIRRQRPNFSLRSYAKHTKINPTSLSLFMRGKRDLSQESYLKIASRLGLPVGDFSPRRDTEFTELRLDTFSIISDWYHYAILSLAETPDFEPDAQWIAQRLNISTENASDAITRLLKLNLLKREGGTLVRTNTFLSTPMGIPNTAARRATVQCLDLARCSLEQDPFETRHGSSMTISIDPNKMPEAIKRIQKFRRRMSDFLVSGDRTEVYHLAVQLFPMSRKIQ